MRLHQEYAVRHGALKKELHLHREENEELEFQVAQLEDCKDQVEELTRHNHFLEERVRELSAPAPPRSAPRDAQRPRARDVLEREPQETNDELGGDTEHRRSPSAGRPCSRHSRCNVKIDCCGTSPAAPDRLRDVWEQLDRAQQKNAEKEEELQRVHRALQHQIRLLGQNQQKFKDTDQKWKTATEATAARHLQMVRALEAELRRCKGENAAEQATQEARTTSLK